MLGPFYHLVQEIVYIHIYFIQRCNVYHTQNWTFFNVINRDQNNHRNVKNYKECNYTNLVSFCNMLQD